jgi:hypothetical protein
VVLSSLGTLLLGCTFFAVMPRRDASGSLVFWTYLAIGLLFLAIFVWQERCGWPTLCHFWEDESGFILTVRSTRTGEILLQSRRRSLSGDDLTDQCLENASLAGIELQYSNLRACNLRGADLRRAQLGGAKLGEAQLQGANLENAHLPAADLQKANLRHARLAGAGFEHADLRGADLRGADFAGRGGNTVLWEKRLETALLEGACYDTATRWPPGFDPMAKGCVLAENPSVRLPIPAETAETRVEQLPVPASSAVSVPPVLPDTVTLEQR